MTGQRIGELLALTGSARLRGPNLRAVIAALPSEACVLWPGKVNRQGYGRVDGSRTKIAHLHVYRLVVGEVPEGLELDHLCRRRLCVNPAHMEPVTHEENIRRGVAARSACPKAGHPYTPENTYTSPAGNRYCRPCRRAADHRRQPRRRSLASV